MMRHAAGDRFPELVGCEHRENMLQNDKSTSEQRIDSLRSELGNALFDELCLRNRFDMQLYSYALGRLDVQLGQSAHAVTSIVAVAAARARRALRRPSTSVGGHGVVSASSAVQCRIFRRKRVPDKLMPRTTTRRRRRIQLAAATVRPVLGQR